jgi:hypothetical protein
MLADSTTYASSDPFWGNRGPRSTVQALRLVYIHTSKYTGEDDARVARSFRNTMIDRIGDPPQPLYAVQSTLDVTLRKSGITQQNRASRYRAEGVLRYSLALLDKEGKKAPEVLDTGIVRSWSSYDVMHAPYSDAIAKRDALDRLGQQLAEQFHTHLASYFAQPKGQTFSPL